MSVQYGTSGADRHTLAEAPDYNAAYTILGWVWFSALTGFRVIYEMHGGSNQNHDAFFFNPGGSGTLYFTSNIGGVDQQDFIAFDIQNAEIWHAFAVQRTGPTHVAVYLGTTADGLALVAQETNGSVSGRTAATEIRFAADVNGASGLGGNLAGLRVFESLPSLAEMKSELKKSTPVLSAWGSWSLVDTTDTADDSGNGRDVVAAGSPTNNALNPPWDLSVSGSGAPTKTLVVSAIGSGGEDANRRAVVTFIELEVPAALGFTGSGAPTKTLSASAAGTATQTFTGSGTPSKTLAPSATGAAVYADVIAATAMPTVTLVASATGEGTHLVDTGTASGAPTKILSTSADGTATQTFTGSGTPEATLVVSAVGSAEMVGFDGPFLVGVTGPLVSTASREIAWPGVAAAAEDSLIEVNDIALLFIGSKNEPIGTLMPGAANSDGNSSNFSPISAATVGVGTAGNATAVRLEVRWARATSHNMRSTLIPDPGAVVIAAMAVFRGCEVAGDPFDVVSTLTVSPAETNVRFQELVTTVTNALIVGVSLNAIDADSTATGSGYTNASLSSITEIFDRAFTTGPGGIGLVGITGEKIEAGTVGDTTGTYIDSVRSAAATIALKPPPAPLDPSTGTGAPTKTLSASAVGAATQKFSGSGAGAATLTASAAGTAAQKFSGSGVLTKTLGVSVVGVATRAADVMSTSADPTVFLSVRTTVNGTAFSEGIPASDPPRLVPGDGGRGRRKPRRILLPEEETEQPRKKRRRPRPAPAPVLEALPLAELPPAPAPFAPVTFDPMLWASVSAPPVRPQTPVVTQQDIAEEEAFLAQLLDLI